jgi:hypothetical protein
MSLRKRLRKRFIVKKDIPITLKEKELIDFISPTTPAEDIGYILVQTHEEISADCKSSVELKLWCKILPGVGIRRFVTSYQEPSNIFKVHYNTNIAGALEELRTEPK